MIKMILPVTILVFNLVFQHGSAAVGKCPVSPDNTVIYFDMEQLGQLALQHEHYDEVHSPIFCVGGTDSECSKQQCCHDEVGCCYTDTNNQVKKCGCKKLGSGTCTYQAPLAILANLECEADKNTTTSVCLRGKRDDDEIQVSTRNTTVQNYTEDRRILPTDPLVIQLGQTIIKFANIILGKSSSPAAFSDQHNTCPLPSISSLVYLDLERLSLTTLQQSSSGTIQFPQACIDENDGDCSKQQCCHGEVGCCYIDHHNNPKRKCGCKKPEDETCTYPAPLAILAHSECDSEHIRGASACLRERRGNEESFIWTHDSHLESPTENKFITVPYSKISGPFSVVMSIILGVIG